MGPQRNIVMDWAYIFANFQGRLNRKPFWIATLVLWLVSVGVTLVASLLFGSQSTATTFLQGVVGLVLLIPSLAVAVKRYHDRDKSGWWILILFIPIIGLIWYIVELGFLPGTPGPNRYGPDPLAAEPFPVRA
jgi:uncharacterized membrane protein YhaH (DUF805 family)